VTIVNSAPTATGVSITGTPRVGQVLTGNYTYADVDGDAQGTSTFRWLRDGSPIGATASTYTVLLADLTHSITFEVTPVAVTGATPGTTVASTGVTISGAPVITSANSAAFTANVTGSFTVTAAGSPAPTFIETGALPIGLSFSSSGVLSGKPNRNVGGTYPITITASNGVLPNAVQSFTITVNQPPAITSANKTTFTVAKADSFTVKASGYPVPTLVLTSGSPPAGVTFSTTTGILTGTPAAGTKGNYALTFLAQSSGGPDAVQAFTLTVK